MFHLIKIFMARVTEMASVLSMLRTDAFRFPARPAFLPMGWCWAALAITLTLALRLVPTTALMALDRESVDGIAPVAATVIPSEAPGAIFPGSAYFFAQDAFTSIAPAGSADDPAVTTLLPEQHNPHVLQIDNGPAALSMPMQGLTFLDQARALQCMTNALYYEAGNEPEEGQRAVAQVILNRLASGRWPNSICGVIYQGTERADRLCQFTFSCDGAMARTPATTSWLRARRIASRALSGEVFAPAGLATFYHTLAVRPPWADRVRPVAVIGAHIFYRLPGEAGMPSAYRMRYGGRETAQPGPYAFAPPPTMPLPAPPGPDLLTGWIPPSVAATTSQYALPPTPAGGPTLAPPSLPFGVTQGDPGAGRSSVDRSHEAGTPGLPQSTIRPEYRNSGRALP
jgi:spore germination cell wall hydrolase CwlJ-like protein